MQSFHADPNLVINAFRLILDGVKEFRTRRGESKPNKQEEVLKETVERAEEMSGKGASAEEVVSAIQTKLERDLGAAAKDEIIGRASSILALSEPFETESFEYYKNLMRVLSKARDLCISANILKLRGTTSDTLELPHLIACLEFMLSKFEALMGPLVCGPVVQARLALAKAFLSTASEPLQIVIVVEFIIANPVGGTYSERDQIALSLTEGREVNRVHFRVVLPPRPQRYLYKDFDVRLTGEGFRTIVSALLADINEYVAELAREQKDFREQISPALAELLSRWP